MMHNHSIYFKQNPCQMSNKFGVFLYCFEFQNFKKIKSNVYKQYCLQKDIRYTMYVNFSKAFVNRISLLFYTNIS